MSNQYLGSYLLNYDLISRDTLNQLLQDQRKTHIMLGVLAINNGLMTAKQITEINALQKQVDKRFGELAIEKGYLQPADVDLLLSQQKSTSVELVQLLLDCNVYTLEKLEEIMTGYRAYTSTFSVSDHSEMDESILYISKLLTLQCAEKNLSYGPHFSEYAALMLKSLIRFIDHSISIDGTQSAVISTSTHSVLQEIVGDFSMKSYLSMDEATYLKFASKYGQMTINTLGELADAAVTEFLNQINGLYTIQVSNQGQSIHLKPPKTVDQGQLNDPLNYLTLTFITEFGHVNLLIKSHIPQKS